MNKFHQRTSSNATLRSDNAFWLFLTNTLNLNNEANMSLVEKTAKKDFSSFYNQLNDDTSDQIARKFSIASTKSISSITDSNIALEWITYSIRQNILLNQLKYLFQDQELLKTYYRPNAFVQDTSYVEDFFNYIKAYEKRDFSMLSNVKRNFFNLKSQSVCYTIIIFG